MPVTYFKQNVMPVTRISAFASAPCSQKQITNINYPTMGRKGERVAKHRITQKMEQRKDIIELTVLMNAIYASNPVGGALHIVLDDGNTEDVHIKWCMENSIADLVGKEHDLYYRCAELLLQMNEWERLYAISNFFEIDRKWGNII